LSLTTKVVPLLQRDANGILTWKGDGSDFYNNSVLTLVSPWLSGAADAVQFIIPTAAVARRHGYEHRKMMEIRNKLANWRRRRRQRSTDRGSVLCTRSVGRRRRRCHYWVSCPTATRTARCLFIHAGRPPVRQSVRPPYALAVTGTLATASVVSRTVTCTCTALGYMTIAAPCSLCIDS